MLSPKYRASLANGMLYFMDSLRLVRAMAWSYGTFAMLRTIQSAQSPSQMTIFPNSLWK